MFKNIQEYYKAENVDSKLPTLTLLMIHKKASQSLKLRATAAEARWFFCLPTECERHMDNSCVPLKLLLLSSGKLLLLEQGQIPGNTKQQSYKAMPEEFLLLRKGLENSADKTWMIRPKPHSFLEMALQGQPCRWLDLSRWRLWCLSQTLGQCETRQPQSSQYWRVLNNFRTRAMPRLRKWMRNGKAGEAMEVLDIRANIQSPGS